MSVSVSSRLTIAAFLAVFVFSCVVLIGKKHEHVDTFCSTPEYRKNALKLVKEAPFAGLFKDLKMRF
jgi:hypothetical protein